MRGRFEKLDQEVSKHVNALDLLWHQHGIPATDMHVTCEVRLVRGVLTYHSEGIVMHTVMESIAAAMDSLEK